MRGLRDSPLPAKKPIGRACALAFFCFIAIVRRLSPGTNRCDASIAALHPPPLGGSCAGPRRREPRRLRPARACGAAARNSGARGNSAGGGGSRAARGAPRPAAGDPETSLPPPPIPGTIGNRPPAQYLPARPAAVSRCIFSTIETARSTPRRSPWRSSPMRWARPSTAIPRRRSDATIGFFRKPSPVSTRWSAMR